jgi:cytochrome c oxidase assembly protein subunit 15
MRSRRLSPRAYRVITIAALVALGTIVVTGAGVRLTGSGLGCSDWPTCEEGQLFAEMDSPHAVAEFANRLFTGVVSLAVILAVLGSLVRQPRRRDLTWLSVGLVAGVVAQIVWGGVTVWSDLAPQMVMGHYLISAVLVADAVVLVVRAGSGGPPTGSAVPGRVVAWSRAMVAAAAVAVVAGTIVTNTGPHAGDEAARRFGFEIVEVVRVHSVAAWLMLALAVATLWQAYRSGPPDRVRRRGALLVAAVVGQGAVGYVQYATGVPAGLVAVHVLGSVLVWVAVLAFHLGLAERPPLESSEEPGPATSARPTDADVVAVS